MKTVELIIKLILIVLLLGCLLKLPYGYYQFVRFAGMTGFALLAYFSFEGKRNSEVIIYVALALLFQPFVKIALGRMIWNVVDVIVSVGLILSLLINSKMEKKES